MTTSCGIAKVDPPPPVSLKKSVRLAAWVSRFDGRLCGRCDAELADPVRALASPEEVEEYRDLWS